MRTLLFSFCLLLTMLTSSAWAEEPSREKASTSPSWVCTEQVESDGTLSFAGRGCCSHHKGQCGCEGGRVVCCDGTLSPSCRCEKDEGQLN